MKKNDYFYGECVDLTYDGQGIVKVDNFTYFVKGMLVGETGKLKVIKVLKNYAIARLIELDQVSKYRTEPQCSVFKACGGCQLQHINIDGQRRFKTKRVRDCLERIGNCHVLVNDCIMMDDPWYYRNKVQMPIGIKDGHLVTGFYKQKSNQIIPCDNCLIQNKLSNVITNRVRELMEELQIHPYDKMARQGNIKHILTKHGYHTNEIMLVLISFQNKINNVEKLVSIITKEYPMDWKMGDEAYYPVNDEKNNSLFEKYRELADKEPNVIFGGRLGNYKYYDMDKVIRAALDLTKTL